MSRTRTALVAGVVLAAALAAVKPAAAETIAPQPPPLTGRLICSVCRPDLVPSVRYEGAVWPVVQWVVVITNFGGPGPASTASVSYWQSGYWAPLTATLSVPALAPGESVSVFRRWVFVNPLAGACADVNGDVGEYDEANNCL